MARATKPIPEGHRTITPYVVARDASAAIEFYKRAFGATERSRNLGPDLSPQELAQRQAAAFKA